MSQIDQMERHHNLEAGQELSMTGSKHDGDEARRKNSKLPKTLILVLCNSSRKPEAQREQKNISDLSRAESMSEGSRSRKSTEKLKVSQCMSSGRNVNHLISCLSAQARGVGTHGSSTCGLTHRRTRCRMWSTRSRRACNRSHASRHTVCHRPELDWLMSYINRHAHLHISTHPDHFRSLFKGGHSRFGTSLRSFAIGGYLRCSRKGFSRGFGQGSKPQRTKHCESRQLIADLFSCRFLLLGSWIMAGGRYRALSIACLISNAKMLCGKEGYVSMSLRGLAGSLRQERLLEYVPTRLGREGA
ncbi:hypothetical protein IGI04_035950 [Brassica rapa subsp. trilocularis]|uniref:Uncharacterized protein n=1 Tax=Brassica rapa subsp. trilocularis TaxID=1813537 RepID=A0ABQ7LD34_BRACM|nr:hypothetical protein IGI04_035950 [Brassica rapa subsp. trilocularis]